MNNTNLLLGQHTHRQRTTDERFAFVAALCRDPELTPADKVIAFVLLDHFNDTAGLTMMSRSTIIECTGLTEKTVGDASHRLERRGWFSVERNLLRTHAYIPAWSRLDEALAA